MIELKELEMTIDKMIKKVHVLSDSEGSMEQLSISCGYYKTYAANAISSRSVIMLRNILGGGRNGIKTNKKIAARSRV